MSSASAKAVWGVGLVLVLYYAQSYLGHSALPGNRVEHPLGWWGWFDQGVTLRSTAALARGNLDPSQHHYPLGYSLLGVPFYSAARNHPYFFVGVLSLLGAYAGFIGFARRLGLPAVVAAAVFALVTVCDAVLFRQWVVPWNTTPVGAFAWLLLACCAAWLDGVRRPVWVGVLAGAIAVCRPSDTVVFLPCAAALLWADRDALLARAPSYAKVAVCLAAVVAPFVALHFAIYGPAQSPYMQSSATYGFTLHDFGWKLYVLFVDPYPWFSDGKGILQHAHWIALGLAGIVPALLRDGKSRMLASVLLVHGALYVSYVDLLPAGLWRFLNIHYFAWAIPGYALLAALLLRDLVAPGRGRIVGAASVVVTLALLCVRVVPRPVADTEGAKAVDFAGSWPPFTTTYLSGTLALQDGEGVLRDQPDMRVFLYPGGVRVVGMRRPIVGPVAWMPGKAPQGFEGTQPVARWAPAVQWAWPPRWLRRASPPGIPVPVS